MKRQPLTAAGQAAEELLPFYATGVLSTAEDKLVADALAADPELRRRLALIEEEQTETILLNEGIGGPSTHVLDKLMAAIDAEPKRTGATLGLGQRLAGWLQSLTPQQAVWATAAAVVVVALQAGALVGLVVNRNNGTTFQTASQLGAATAQAGAAFTIIFQPDAKASDIAALLEKNGARIVDGPRAGGIFRIMIGDKSLSEAESAALMTKLRTESTLVRMMSPAR
ncbi:MAG: hypothetical protein ACRCUE_07695 [Bosea sp. (in: a-proteobacteria)]